jgi:hypothetical protein
MASQLSAKLSLDVKGFEQGMQDAKQSTEQYQTQLGDLSKKFTSVRKELGQTRRAAVDMESAWRSMSDAQKKSFEGQELQRQLQTLKERGADLVDILGDIGTELRNRASDTKALDVAKQGFDVLGNSVSLAANAYAAFTGDSEDAKRALTIFATVQSTVNTLTGLQNALQKQSSLMLAITTAQQKLKTKAIEMDTVAQGKNIVATKGATAAQWALNIAADANPYVLLISALVAAGVALVAFTKYAGEAAEKEKKQREETEKLKQAVEEFAQAAGNEYGKLRSSYEQLKKEWNDLSSAHEKSEWLKKNKKDVDDLTNSVHDVISADKFFNDETGDVIKSFKLRAQAAAAAALATKYYQKSLEASLQKNKAANVNGSFISVETYNKLPEEIKKKAKPNYTLTWEAGNGAGQYGTPTAASSGMGGMVAKNVVNGYTLQGLTDAEVLKYGLTNQRFAKDEIEFEKIADAWIEKYDEFDKQVVHKPVADSTSNTNKTSNKPDKVTEEEVKGSLADLEKTLSEFQDKYKKGLLPNISAEEYKSQVKKMEDTIKRAKITLGIEIEPEEGSINYFKGKISELENELGGISIYVDGEVNPEFINKLNEIKLLKEQALTPDEKLQKQLEESQAKEAEYYSNKAAEQEREKKLLKEKADEQMRIYDAIGQSAQGVGSIMSSISQLAEDESFNTAGIIMEAVANIALEEVIVKILMQLSIPISYILI